MTSSATVKYLLLLVLAAVVLHSINYMIISRSLRNGRLRALELALRAQSPLRDEQHNFYIQTLYLANTGVAPLPYFSSNFNFEGCNTDLELVEEPSENVTNYLDNEGGLFSNGSLLCPLLTDELGKQSGVVNIGEEFSFPVRIAESAFVGGSHKPRGCLARQRVAVIVPYPYEDMDVRLGLFLYATHPLLQLQQLEYRIFVIKTYGFTEGSSAHMSHGMLMNIGVREVERLSPAHYDCFVFHNAELLPTDGRNLYRCGENITQLVTSSMPVDVKLFGDRWVKLTPIEMAPVTHIRFGFVMAMTKKQLDAVNGFSNTFHHGWPSLVRSSKTPNVTISIRSPLVSQYSFFGSTLITPPPFAYLDGPEVDLEFGAGLSGVKYTVLSVKENYLHTAIVVETSATGPLPPP